MIPLTFHVSSKDQAKALEILAKVTSLGVDEALRRINLSSPSPVRNNDEPRQKPKKRRLYDVLLEGCSCAQCVDLFESSSPDPWIWKPDLGGFSNLRHGFIEYRDICADLEDYLRSLPPGDTVRGAIGQATVSRDAVKSKEKESKIARHELDRRGAEELTSAGLAHQVLVPETVRSSVTRAVTSGGRGGTNRVTTTSTTNRTNIVQRPINQPQPVVPALTEAGMRRLGIPPSQRHKFRTPVPSRPPAERVVDSLINDPGVQSSQTLQSFITSNCFLQYIRTQLDLQPPRSEEEIVRTCLSDLASQNFRQRCQRYPRSACGSNEEHAEKLLKGLPRRRESAI